MLIDFPVFVDVMDVYGWGKDLEIVFVYTKLLILGFASRTIFLSSGIEPVGNRVMQPAMFTVDTFSAGQGQVMVYVEDPEGRREEVKAVLNEGKKTYSVMYIPQVMGPHKVSSRWSRVCLLIYSVEGFETRLLCHPLQVTVLFAGQEIPKSPFEVNVDKAQGDPTKVTAKGPGIEPVGNIANKPTYFDIYTAGLSAVCVDMEIQCMM